MTYYIAGPMTGLSEFNYPAFDDAARKLRDRGYDVISPHELHDGDVSQRREFYLRRDLRALLDCDAVIVLPGWHLSAGASLEVRVAYELAMRVQSIAAVIGTESGGMNRADQPENGAKAYGTAQLAILDDLTRQSAALHALLDRWEAECSTGRTEDYFAQQRLRFGLVAR